MSVVEQPAVGPPKDNELVLQLPDDPDLQTNFASTELAADTLRGLDSTTERIVFLPRSRLDNGAGLYSNASMFLAKELRASGLSVEFLDRSDRRTFEVRKSAVTELTTLAISIGGSLTTNTVWFYIERVLDRRSRRDQGGDDSDNTVDTDTDGESELEVTIIDPLAPPEANTLVLRGRPDVVIRAAAKIARGNPPDDDRRGGQGSVTP